MSLIPIVYGTDNVHASLARAQELHEADRLAEAETEYRKVLLAEPRSFAALHGLGLIALRQRRLEDGARWVGAALEADPRQPDAWLHLSRAQLLLGQSDGALQSAERALALRPGDPAAQLARAATLMAGRPREEGLAILKRTVEQMGDNADAWNELGAAQLGLHHDEDAAASFQRALQIDPDNRSALVNFGQTLQVLKRFEDAALVFERLWQVWPDCAFAAGQLLHCKMLICDWLKIDVLRQRVDADVAAGLPAAEPFGIQAYCTSPATLRRCAETYIGSFFPDRAATLPPVPLSAPGERVRIGYVSGEFRHQATSILLTELLETHDRSRFEIVAFDNGWDDGSELRRRIEAAVDALVPIRGLDDQQAAAQVREHRVDILVNLNGFFGAARTGLFSLRPAPIQVNYLGFPGTLGAPFIDYLIADHWVIPEADQVHYNEAVVYLPDSYQPNDSKRRISDQPLTRRDVGLPDSGVVFCCFNNNYKYMPEVFDIWMRLLQRVPGSVMWLYWGALEARENLMREAEARGVDKSRLVFAPHWPLDRHLARLRLADLFLDTWPYNAHTTGSDALWAGVPVVTCTGDTFPSRVGASLLAAVGLPELITSNFADYEALACRLATEPSALTRVRQALEANRSGAPLFDTRRLAQHIEAAYATMIERARSGLAPAGFGVESSCEI